MNRFIQRPTLGFAIAITMLSAIGTLPLVFAENSLMLASASTGATKDGPGSRALSKIIYNDPPPPPSSTGATGPGTASRGQCTRQIPLTPLVPGRPVKTQPSLTVVFGQTISNHPTFWFYVPYGNADDFPAKFVLQDSDQKEIYSTPVQLPETPGIIRVQMSSKAPDLKVNQLYRWSLQVKCDSPPVEASGSIQRVALPPTVMQEIQAATPQQQIVLYAKHGLWFDALTGLAELRRKTDQALTDDWLSLLKQGGFNDDIAKQKITN